MTPTCDPHVCIEDQGDGWTRYRATDGRRWEAHGRCDRRGDCLIGVVIDGFGVIEDHDDIAKACALLGVNRLVSDLDVPITPGFSGCCPFDFVVLS